MISDIINLLKKYVIANSFVLVDFFFVRTFVIKIIIIKKRQKSEKHFKLVPQTSVVRVLFRWFEPSLTLTPPPPPYNFSDGPYDQYMVEVTGGCSQ